MPAALTPSRIVAAVAVLLLAAGTAFAASPSPSPSASASASASGLESAKASESPEASEAPEVSAAPETSDGPEVSGAAKGEEKPDVDKADDDKADADDAPGTPPTAAEAADVVGKLKAAGITTTTAAFQALAAKVGVGGAVRTLPFAQASGKTPDQIVAMFQGGKGWGQIDHELGLKINPGIGWIMGHGHAKGASK